MYGDCVLAHRACFQIFKVAEAGTVNAGKYERIVNQLDYGYGKHIIDSKNGKLEIISIQLPKDTPLSTNPFQILSPQAQLPLQLLMIQHTTLGAVIVLCLDFPATELVINNGVSEFGKCFGVPFNN